MKFKLAVYDYVNHVSNQVLSYSSEMRHSLLALITVVKVFYQNVKVHFRETVYESSKVLISPIVMNECIV